MSRPNYQGFGTDLDALQEKLVALETSLKDAFSAKIDKKQLKEPAAGYCQDMKNTLDYLKTNIDVLKSGEIAPEVLATYDYEKRETYNKDQRRAWGMVREFIHDYRPEKMPNIPYKRDGEYDLTPEKEAQRIQEHQETFTKELDDPDVRKIWNLSQQLSDLSLDVDMMEQRDKYRSLKTDIDEHCAEINDFSRTLREFDADLSERENYSDVLKETKAAENRLKEEQAEYDYQHSEERTREKQVLLDQQKKNLKDQLEGKLELNERLKTSQEIISGYQKELDTLNRQINAETAADEKRKAETAQLRAKVEQNEKTLREIDADSDAMTQRTEQYRTNFETEQNKLDGLQKELEQYSNGEKNLKPYADLAKNRYHASPSSEMKQAAANEAELARSYQKKLDAQELLNRYNAAMNDAMMTADPGNTTVEARMALVSQGKSLRESREEMYSISQDSEDVQRIKSGAMNAYAAHEQYKELFRQKFPVKPEAMQAIDESGSDLLTEYLSDLVADYSKSIEEMLEKDNDLNKLHPDEAQTHRQKMEEIRKLGNEGKVKGLQSYTDEKANQTVYTDLRKNQPSKNASEEAKKAAQYEADLASYYDKEQKAQRVYDAYRAEMKAAGFDKLDPAKRDKLLNEGNNFAKIQGEEIKKQLIENNEAVRNAFKMKDIQERYCKELKETCGANETAVEAAAHSPEELERCLAGSVEDYKDLQEKTLAKDKALKLDPAEQALHDKAIGSIGEAYGKLKNQGQLIQNSEMVYLESNAQLEIAQAKKMVIEAENEAHQQQIQKNEGGGNLPEYLEEKEKLLGKLNEEQAVFNTHNAALNELRHNNDATAEKIAALENEVNTSEKNLESAQKRVEKAKYCEEKTTELTDKQRRLMNNRKELNEKLNPRGQNSAVTTMWDRSCHQITDKMQNFRDTANYGKVKGHKDGVHYTKMMEELNQFTDKADAGLMNRDPEKMQAMLESVGKAAQDYIDTRNKDWFKSNSTIRQTRLDYADRLVKYTAQAAANLQKMAQEDKALKEKARGLNASAVDQPDYGDKLFGNMKQIGAKNILEQAQRERQNQADRENPRRSRVNQSDLHKEPVANKPPMRKGFGN